MGGKGTRLWLSSLTPGQPIKVSTELREYPPLNAPATPEISKPVAREWQTNYAVFSDHLVSAADKAHLDSASLAKVLFLIRSAEANGHLAILPFEAHSTYVKGDLAWVVGLRWEMKDWVQRNGYMGHVRRFAFTQKTLKLVEFQTCD